MAIRYDLTGRKYNLFEAPILTRNSLQSARAEKSLALPSVKVNMTRLPGRDNDSVPVQLPPAVSHHYQQIAFNVRQPEYNADSLHALISRLGDQKFRAFIA